MVLASAWFYSVFPEKSVALTMLIVSLVAGSGLALGSLRIRGLSLGIPGVMFTGLLFAWLLGPGKLDEQVVAFIRDFGLILFVYAVGIQVGPGFFASMRKRGWTLNLMAVAIVVLGWGMSLGVSYATRTDMRAAVGLFAGATTNAPALGSAGEALKSIHHDHGTYLAEIGQKTGPAFAISYPFGLGGVILAMVLMRVLFRVQIGREEGAIAEAEKDAASRPQTLNIELQNTNLRGLTVGRIAQLGSSAVVISRVLHQGKLMVATPDTPVELGDVLLAVGTGPELADLRLIVGQSSGVDLRSMPSKITTRLLLVTKREVLGKTIDEMDLPRRLGVTVTRVERTGLEFTAVGGLRLQFGDRVRAVGEDDSIAALAKELGDSARALNLPRLLPIFLGIALGVILGSIPIAIQGLPAQVKLGLASGPLIAAIVLARVGRVGSLIWYMPPSASALLRELGITLFLIAVGLLAGQGFFDSLTSSVGPRWLILGAMITLVPLLIVGAAARLFFKMNYLHLCGVLCGSMTSPSLAFTNTMSASEAPALAFATVYPLTMILRVLLAQLMVLMFVR